MILFLVGLVIGLATYRVYLKYQKSKFLKDNISLKLVERSKDVIYYYQVMPVYKHIYTSPSVDFFLGKGTLEALNKDRKSTRLNSSHVKISYAVFCLKKKR